MRTAILFLIACSLHAEPFIRDLAPRGAQPGQTVRLTLKGSGLEGGARMLTTLPGAVSRLAPASGLMRPGSELPFLIELRKDAGVGVYPIRVHTDDGLSNLVLFSISQLPEQDEIESEQPRQTNGDTRQAQPLAIPGVMNGALTEADIDLYSFPAKAGQKIVFEVEASRIGSAIDPAIEILDASGKILDKNDDAPGAGIDSRLEFTFPQTGTYYARVHDSKYSNQRVNHYRLKAGQYSYADSVYPLALTRNQPGKVTLSGGNLAQPVEVSVDTSAKSAFAQVQVPGSQSLPMLVELSGIPAAPPGTTELTNGLAVDSRIAAPAQTDKYTLAVKPGEHWVLEVLASRHQTSRLDAMLTVKDSAGKKIAVRDDLAGADPVLPFEIPEKTDRVIIEVEDLLRRGGPDFGYRLTARRAPADFTVTLISPYVNIPPGGAAQIDVQVQRRGYDGAVRLTIPDLPPGLHQSGGNVAPAAAQQRFDDPNPRFSAVRSTITITADPSVTPQSLALNVAGIAHTADGKIERRATGPGLVVGVTGLRQKAVTASWLDIGLPAAMRRAAPARLTSPIPLARIAQGVEFPLAYRLERDPGVTLRGRVRNNIASSVGNLRILQGPPGKTADSGSFLFNTNFATPTEKVDMQMEATVEIDGRTETIYAPIVTIEVVPGYQLRLPGDRFSIKPGAKLEISGSVYREPTFEGGLIQISASFLPDGVTCPQIEVPADHKQFTLRCTAEPAAAPGEYEFAIASAAPDTGAKAKDTYKIPDHPAKLKITTQ